MKKLNDLEVNDFVERVETLINSWYTCNFQVCINQIEVLKQIIKEDTTGYTDLYEEIVSLGYKILNRRIDKIYEQLVPQ